MAKTYQRADAYTIDQLKENIREMQAEKLARDARLEVLAPLVVEHAQLLNEQNHEISETFCEKLTGLDEPKTQMVREGRS